MTQRILTVACAAAAILASPTARADLLLGADIDAGVPLEVGKAVDPGVGVAGRLGAHFHVPLLALAPELVGSYQDFGGTAGPRVYRGMAGLRLGIGEIVRPGVYSHIGVGRLNASGPDRNKYEQTSFALDAGAMLELTLIPVVNIGIHGAYNRLFAKDVADFDWVTLGAHVNVIF